MFCALCVLTVLSKSDLNSKYSHWGREKVSWRREHLKKIIGHHQINFKGNLSFIAKNNKIVMIKNKYLITIINQIFACEQTTLFVNLRILLGHTCLLFTHCVTQAVVIYLGKSTIISQPREENPMVTVFVLRAL